jgi:endoribonuclease Nob1
MQDLPPGDEVYATAGVLEELRKYKDRRADLWGDLLKVTEPTADSLKRVREAAKCTGDSGRISQTDAGVLALALDIGASILTDDYSIQNLATYLGIPYRPVGTKGIREMFRWRWRCVGCGRTFDKEHLECPVCGSELRSSRSREH